VPSESFHNGDSKSSLSNDNSSSDDGNDCIEIDRVESLWVDTLDSGGRGGISFRGRITNVMSPGSGGLGGGGGGVE
jgi:hypothetical protein